MFQTMEISKGFLYSVNKAEIAKLFDKEATEETRHRTHSDWPDSARLLTAMEVALRVIFLSFCQYDCCEDENCNWSGREKYIPLKRETYTL